MVLPHDRGFRHSERNLSSLKHPSCNDHSYASYSPETTTSSDEDSYIEQDPETGPSSPVASTDSERKTLNDIFKDLTGRDLPGLLVNGGPVDENVVTVVDATGREFVTNLRLCDLKHLVKQSLLAKGKAVQRAPPQSKLHTLISEGKRKRAISPAPPRQDFQAVRDDPTVLRNELYNGRMERDAFNGVRDALLNLPLAPLLLPLPVKGRGFYCSQSETLKIAEMNGIGPALQLKNPSTGSRRRQTFGEAGTLAAFGHSAPSPVPYERMRLTPLTTDITHYYTNHLTAVDRQRKNEPKAKARGSFRRCRGVYGIEHQDRWCNMCRWKKRCSRFGADSETYEE